MTKRLVDLGPAGGIPEGEVRVFGALGRGIAVARIQGALYAIEDICTHDEGPLGEGQLQGCEIECPRHGARFDFRSGAVTRMPAAAPVATFPVQVREGRVLVEMDEE
jgi:3-phenylpropionate/trans-cinnamate dioxygenase ferredoxin component